MKSILEGKLKLTTKQIESMLDTIDIKNSNAPFIINVLIIQRLNGICDDILAIKKAVRTLELNVSNNRVFSRLLMKEIQDARKQMNRRSTDKRHGRRKEDKVTNVVKGKKVPPNSHLRL